MRWISKPMLIWIALLTQVMGADCIAHRGNSTEHPDNTVAAIESAWDSGADVVELDVQFLNGDTVVLFHDDEHDDVPLAELDHETLNARIPEYHVPTLKEGLISARPGKTLLLDLKVPSETFLNQVLEEVRSSAPAGAEIMMQSTNLKALKFLRENAPSGTKLFYVTSLRHRGKAISAEGLAKKLADHQLQGITAKGRQFVDADYVNTFHNLGLKYFVWTINDTERMKHYVDLGVDGVITDDPSAYREVVPKQQPEGLRK